MLSWTLVAISVAVLSASADEKVSKGVSKVVNTAQGPVKGFKNPEHGIFEFKSIPYATAPTGRDKFKAPLPPPVWEQPLEALDKRIICPQSASPFAIIFENYTMQEDCLLINVHVPDTDKNNLSVVFYVHGGAFQIGFGDISTIPKELIHEYNIIFVSFNHRLGVHGFLSLGTEDVPGNAGIKDQVAALRWVKKNIASFGGDPDDITLQGSSAGSAAVDLLMLSKSTEGLFNKVIPESGANVGAWAIQSDPLNNAKWFAKTLNFMNVDDINALEDFYKTADLALLTSYSLLNEKDSTFVFSPCVERASSNEHELFLDKSPVDILKSGNYPKVPILYGFANMEGLFRAPLFDIWKFDMNKKFLDFLPADLKFKSVEEQEEIAKKVKQYYFGDKPVQEDNILEYVNYFTDVLFAYPTLRAVKYHVAAGHDQIYLYEYSFVDENTPFVPHTNVKGADHCAQNVAVFNVSFVQPEATKSNDFKKMSANIRKIWGNFIDTGVPVSEGSVLPAWPAAGEGWSPHMSLGNEITLRGSLLESRMRFWDAIYEQYYRDPVPATISPTRRV